MLLFLHQSFRSRTSSALGKVPPRKIVEKTAGWSLIEMLIALLISAMLLAWGGIVISHALHDVRLKKTAELLLQTLAHYAEVAVLSGHTMHIGFNRESKRVFLHEEPAQGPNGTLPADKELFSLPNGVHFREIRSGGFGKTGNVFSMRPDNSATAGTIILENDEKQTCSIVQSVLGARRLLCAR